MPRAQQGAYYNSSKDRTCDEGRWNQTTSIIPKIKIKRSGENKDKQCDKDSRSVTEDRRKAQRNTYKSNFLKYHNEQKKDPCFIHQYKED